jgi:hypothetical protein
MGPFYKTFCASNTAGLAPPPGRSPVFLPANTAFFEIAKVKKRIV